VRTVGSSRRSVMSAPQAYSKQFWLQLQVFENPEPKQCFSPLIAPSIISVPDMRVRGQLICLEVK
jgi:hypothetical protein